MSIHSVSVGGVCLYVCVIHFYVAESVTISSPKVGPHLVLTASVKPSLAAAAPTCCSNQSNIRALNLRRSTAVQTLMRYGLQAPPWASEPRHCQWSSQQMKAWNSFSVIFTLLTDFFRFYLQTELCCFSYIDTSQGLNVQLKLLHWSFSLELKLSANADRW